MTALHGTGGALQALGALWGLDTAWGEAGVLLELQLAAPKKCGPYLGCGKEPVNRACILPCPAAGHTIALLLEATHANAHSDKLTAPHPVRQVMRLCIKRNRQLSGASLLPGVLALVAVHCHEPAGDVVSQRLRQGLLAVVVKQVDPERGGQCRIHSSLSTHNLRCSHECAMCYRTNTVPLCPAASPAA